MAATISDVAKLAKVSRTTVSRVLAQTPGFKYSEATRGKVEQAARELNYTPSAAAQLLRLKDSKMIGVVTQATSPQIVHILQQKCNTQLTALGYYPIFIDLNETYETFGANPLNRFEYLQGVICMHSKQALSVTRFCEKRKLDVQIVSMANAKNLPDDVRVVATDHCLGIQKAVHYLAEQGHQRVGYLLYKPGNVDIKHTGFQAGVTEHKLTGVGIDSSSADSKASAMRNAYNSAQAVVEAKVTAVICQNDESALGLISGLTSLGVRVPEDVSVIGYDNLPFAEFANPGLTTIAQQVDQLSHDAAKLMVSCIEATDVQREYLPKKLLIEPELIIRQSTGKPTIS